MYYIVVFGLVFIYFVSPFVRFLFHNLHKVIYQGVVSFYEYFKYKKYNVCNDYGYIDCYCGLFGQGKTKQAVERCYKIFKTFNGKKIWFPAEQCFITQTINIYSNVVLCGIPYIPFYSMQQMIDCAGSDYGTVNIFLIDEASVVFNSRDYKSNFNSLSLNTILTSRHHRIGIILTSQRFNHLDALLRQVVSHVIQCSYMPFFHIQREIKYNAWDLECSKNPNLCKPLSTRYTYTSSFNYSLYDTFAMVQNVKKACSEKEFITDTETLISQGDNIYNNQLINRKLKKPKH